MNTLILIDYRLKMEILFMEKEKFQRERRIDDELDISDIELKPQLQEIVDMYIDMIEREDSNTIRLNEDLDMFFKNAYGAGEITFSERKKLEEKYRV